MMRPLGVALLVTALLGEVQAAEDEKKEVPGGQWSLIIENDSIQSNSDRHYTHGMRLSYLCAAGETAAPCGWAQPLSDKALGGLLAAPRLDLELAQSIFTPTDIHIRDPDRRDRPYAGWLYFGAALLDERRGEDGEGTGLERLALQIGVVGPHAYAEDVQNTWHQFIGARRAIGWNHQLNDEPGLVLAGTHKWRFLQPLGSGFTIDAIPEAGLSLGNVFTYGEIGGMVRIGQHIGFDYGPARIEPALDGTDYRSPGYITEDAPWGWYIFAGNQDRLVARNIFLDGNSFESSRHVPKKPFVADLTTGAAMTYGEGFRLAFSFTVRTDEFRGQSLGPDQFSAISLSFRF
jgi:hypothetical protein